MNQARNQLHSHLQDGDLVSVGGRLAGRALLKMVLEGLPGLAEVQEKIYMLCGDGSASSQIHQRKAFTS